MTYAAMTGRPRSGLGTAMRHAVLAACCLGVTSGSGLAQVATPFKAKGVKGEFVTAYAPCVAPSLTTNPPLALPACPLVRRNPTCGFGPKGKGKYSVKLFGTDLKVGASLSGVAGCIPNPPQDLRLVMSYRFTTTDCTGGDCSSGISELPIGTCTLVDGKCVIKTTVETAFGATDLFKDGNTYNLELGEVCVVEGATGQTAFCGGIVIGPAQAGTATTSTTTTTVPASTTTSTTTTPVLCGAFATSWGTSGGGNGQFSFPTGVATDPSGNVYVADSGNGRIQKFTANGTFLTKWSSGFINLVAVATDASGNVYTTESSGRIQKFTADGTLLTQWGSSGTGDGQFVQAAGIAADPSGSIYVVDSGNGRIQKFTSGGTFLAKWGTLGSFDGQFNQPYGVATDPGGNVYVADYLNNRIQKFTGTGMFLAKVRNVSYPVGVVMSPNGGLLVSSPDFNEIFHVSETEVLLGSWTPLSAPYGVATDGSGNVYVAEPTGARIEKFTCPPGAVNSVCCSNTSPGGLGCNNVASPSDCPGTAGALGTVCNGDGTCTSPQATVGGACCEVPLLVYWDCFGGPGVTSSFCSQMGGSYGSSQVCTPAGECVAP